MLPTFLLTVMTPLATVHCAGDLSFVPTHSFKLEPSNRTMASDGGAASVAAGVTTFGTGSQTSVSCGVGLPVCGAAACCATSDEVNANGTSTSDIERRR